MSTLSSLLRLGWDWEPLEACPNRKKNALRGPEAHVGNPSGLITPDEAVACPPEGFLGSGQWLQ